MVPAPTRHTVLLQRGAESLAVTVDGAAGAPVVMLPSSLREPGDFDEVARHMAARGFRVLRPWPRGMGRSNGSLAGLSLSVLAADAVHAVQELGGGSAAILVGHAFGHFVARVADLEHPTWVRGVVVAAAAARVFPEGMADSLRIASDPAQPEALRLEHLRRAFFAVGNDPRPWLEGWHPELRATYRNAGAVPEKSAWWPVTHAPILDLQAEADAWRPPATRLELHRALGGKVQVQVIANASHAMVYEQPAAVAQAIAAWERSLHG